MITFLFFVFVAYVLYVLFFKDTVKRKMEEADGSSSSITKQFMYRCRKIIEDAENQIQTYSPLTNSCKDDVMKVIKDNLPNMELTWENIEESCYFSLFNASFILLTSYEYHLKYSALVVGRPQPILELLYARCNKWLYEHNHITKDEYEENKKGTSSFKVES